MSWGMDDQVIPDRSAVKCRECGKVVAQFLPTHLGEAHGMHVDDYLAKHPGAPTISLALHAKLGGRLDPSKDRPGLVAGGPPATVPVVGIKHRVYLGVPPEACLPLPKHYKPPVQGQAGVAMFHLSLSMRDEPAIYVHGPPGTGKDAAFHYISCATQRPTLVVPIAPRVDLRPWISSRNFEGEKIVWEDGPLTKAVRDGYGPQRVPYLVLFTDIDRAEPDQLEPLRMMLDSILGRIVTLDGKTERVLAGTQFAATANTAGDGEGSMLNVTAKAQDASLLDRFTVKLRWFDPELDEVFPTIMEAFPDLAQGGFFPLFRKSMDSLRKSAQSTMTVFSMRDAFAVCRHARRLVQTALWNPEEDVKLTLGALRIWFGGLSDDKQGVVRSILQPHFRSLPAEKDMP